MLVGFSGVGLGEIILVWFGNCLVFFGGGIGFMGFLIGCLVW